MNRRSDDTMAILLNGMPLAGNGRFDRFGSLANRGRSAYTCQMSADCDAREWPKYMRIHNLDDKRLSSIYIYAKLEDI